MIKTSFCIIQDITAKNVILLYDSKKSYFKYSVQSRTYLKTLLGVMIQDISFQNAIRHILFMTKIQYTICRIWHLLALHHNIFKLAEFGREQQLLPTSLPVKFLPWSYLCLLSGQLLLPPAAGGGDWWP